MKNFQVPGYPDWYNICYEGDEAVHTYKLMEDYQEKNLEVIVWSEWHLFNSILTCQEMESDIVVIFIYTFAEGGHT